jgi:hypothetical protein
MKFDGKHSIWLDIFPISFWMFCSTHRRNQLARSLRVLASNSNKLSSIVIGWMQCSRRACELTLVMNGKEPPIQSQCCKHSQRACELVLRWAEKSLYMCAILLASIQLLYGFRVWMAWSKHAGMLRELRKARETRAEGEWFCALAFLNSSNIPKRLDQAIQTRKP